MAAASRSSSAAPSRSEHLTWSTTHRPGAICASEVTRGGGGGAASGGGAACCDGGAVGWAHAPRQHASRIATAYRFIGVPPVCRGILVSGARASSRSSTYYLAKPTYGSPA